MMIFGPISGWKTWNPNRQSWRRRLSFSSLHALPLLCVSIPFGVDTRARSRPHLRRPWSVIFLLRQAWVRVPELLPLFSSSCSPSTPLPPFSLFLVIFLFGVLRVLHVRRLASKHFLPWIVLCALLPFFCVSVCIAMVVFWRDVLGDMCSRMQLCFSFSTSFLRLEEENLVSKVRRVVLVSVDSWTRKVWWCVGCCR